MRNRDYLFSQIDTFSVQQNRRQQMQAEIASFDPNRLLNANVDDLVTYFVERHLVEVPDLLEEEMVVDQREAQRDVSGDPMRRFFYDRHSGPIMVTGAEISVDLPFSGDPKMFDVQPATHTLNPPRGVVRGNILTSSFWGDNLNADQVRGEIASWLSNIRQHLQWQRDSFRALNQALPQEAHQAISKRRNQLLANLNLVVALGIPLKRRTDAPMMYVAPEVKRKLMPKLPPATPGIFKPEPILEEVEYQHILGVLESMAHVLERSPKTFHHLDEEGIRTHFLVQLNGHYEGQASGETFNYQGKTDILVDLAIETSSLPNAKFGVGRTSSMIQSSNFSATSRGATQRQLSFCLIETGIFQGSSLRSRKSQWRIQIFKGMMVNGAKPAFDIAFVTRMIQQRYCT